MSALGGIYYFDNRPVDRDFLVRLMKKLESHGPDGGSEVISGCVGMGYRAFHTNRESRLEKQPVITDAGHVLVWDGRLDNREELISLLANDLQGDRTDVAIVMAAYLRWHDDFLPHLIGDFALSLWNSRTRTLLLARDAVGPRPLYYHANRERIVWSSELTPLLDLTDIHLEVNDEYVAGFLTRGVDPHLTPYQGIHAVTPGTVLLVQGDVTKERIFWCLDPNYEVRYKTDADYEEHFRDLFREAVRCRLRVEGPVWASLSGGLDSSAIVCAADEIFERGEAEASRLETVSHVYDESSSSDERAFIRCVEEKRKRIGHHLGDRDYPPLSSFPDESKHSFPDFFDCFVDLHRGFCEAMRRDGARVLLTGHGGDEVLCSRADPSPELGDMLIRGRLLSLDRSLKLWSKASKRSYLDLLWNDGIVPLLPTGVRMFFPAKPQFKLPQWFDEKFTQRMALCRRLDGFNQVRGFEGFSLPSGRDQAAGFLAARRVVSKAAYRARGSIEVSHPYLHRPLVEFLQAVPFEQRVRPGESRSLMRRALKDLLPHKILNRRGKKGPDEALFRALAREWLRLRPIFKNPSVASRGYINAERLQEALLRARHGCEPYSYALVQTIALEFWLCTLERRSSIAKNAA